MMPIAPWFGQQIKVKMKNKCAGKAATTKLK